MAKQKATTKDKDSETQHSTHTNIEKKNMGMLKCKYSNCYLHKGLREFFLNFFLFTSKTSNLCLKCHEKAKGVCGNFTNSCRFFLCIQKNAFLVPLCCVPNASILSCEVKGKKKKSRMKKKRLISSTCFLCKECSKKF